MTPNASLYILIISPIDPSFLLVPTLDKCNLTFLPSRFVYPIGQGYNPLILLYTSLVLKLKSTFSYSLVMLYAYVTSSSFCFILLFVPSIILGNTFIIISDPKTLNLSKSVPALSSSSILISS